MAFYLETCFKRKKRQRLPSESLFWGYVSWASLHHISVLESWVLIEKTTNASFMSWKFFWMVEALDFVGTVIRHLNSQANGFHPGGGSALRCRPDLRNLWEFTPAGRVTRPGGILFPGYKKMGLRDLDFSISLPRRESSLRVKLVPGWEQIGENFRDTDWDLGWYDATCWSKTGQKLAFGPWG